MASVGQSEVAASPQVGRFRWVIVALLFAATAINYVDRQMIGLLKPTLEQEFGWSETTYADIVFYFQLAYAIGYIVFGNVVDRIGARAGYAIAFLIWTTAHMLHGAARSAVQFAMVRFLLGIGESGNFPAGIKAVTEWFPKKERAFATGIFNAGANVGAVITPLIVPVLVLTYGWQAAFVITGAGSLIWLVAWLALYRRPRESTHVSEAEIAYIESDPADTTAKVPWSRLLRVKETWAFAIGKFLTDPIWWMFLFWTPDFLVKRHGLDLKTFGPPLVVIYLVSDLGSIAGGWMSSKLIHRGWSINAARKTTMLICAIAVTPIFFAQYVDDLWTAVAIISLATAAHQAWSANLYTLPGDTFPRKAVGSVIGIGGTAGAIGGMLFALYIGQILERVGSYGLIFVVAGSVYLIALTLIHLLMPRMDQALPSE
ncbi:MFS transporter [Sphingomonas sp. NSE70-1]|uniref:MFS transporter n=1 Tax=Sphingomonas caseinilyticus TaxID=2908205 RepID=A0ABT0RU98_9SPHN|nr:MFS transporter [Sphingomonas caseinilyticus]MCL6698600.1 MFS transporter [Sphingomonas caseinilyticus]